MKKLLGISLIAALAVSPMMARAEVTQGLGSAVIGANEGKAGPLGQNETALVAAGGPAFTTAKVESNDDALATGTYVKGAYNAAISAINKEYDRAKTAEGDMSQFNNANGLNGMNLATAIVTTKEEADQNKANIGATQDNKIQVRGQTTASDSSDDEFEDTVAEAVQKLATEIDGVDDKVGNAEFTDTDLQGAGDLTGAIELTKDALDTLSNTMTGSFATKNGVEETIDAAVAGLRPNTTGTVPVLTQWGNNNATGTVDITATTTLNSENYEAAYVDSQANQ